MLSQSQNGHVGAVLDNLCLPDRQHLSRPALHLGHRSPRIADRARPGNRSAVFIMSANSAPSFGAISTISGMPRR